jgi:uncharacterized membrane protein|tara:strand:+ start:54 stop:530 length:477 start_codon:yes stop_codon:yes gene_type:complete
MNQDILELFLLSISPLGEAKLAIPFFIKNSNLELELILLVGLLGNLLIFPLFYKLIEISNKKLLNNKIYKKYATLLSLRARKKTKNVVKKYGLWGLMFFVMIPIPFTGAYIGTLAAYIFKTDYKKTFYAISIGLLISCTIIAYLGAAIMEYFKNTPLT